MRNVERINGFDALRTIAMWLGIVLHSIIVYKIIPEPNWPHDPQMNLYFLDWLYAYIHIFRMPIFFLVAGFFARLVIMRSGLTYFIKQRFKRIVVPFILGVILIVPLTLLPFHFYENYYVQHQPLETAWRTSLLQMFKVNGLAHLWFLYYLTFFYTFSLIARYILIKLKINFGEKWQHTVVNISLLKLLIAAIILFIILFSYQVSELPVYTGIRPNVLYLLYYGFFYACGWLIQINMKSITSLNKNSWPLFILGTAISVIKFWKENSFDPAIDFSLTAIQTISLVAGITGLFMKYFHAENKIWRYFSDAAYWVYLIHLCIVSSLQVALLNSPIAPWLRLPIVLIVTFSLSLLSYHFLVRYTLVGEYLHGKRKKRVGSLESGVTSGEAVINRQ